MKLKSVTFKQYYQSETNKNEWTLGNFPVKDINLLVGKNATGKTRTLNIISTLSKLLSSQRKELPGDHFKYTVVFDNKGEKSEYKLSYKAKKVYEESFKIGTKLVLSRGKKGAGEIYFQELEKRIKFQVPEENLASVSKRDNVQHPFLESLYQWGESVRYYKFGEKMGSDIVSVLFEDEGTKSSNELIDPKTAEKVVGILHYSIKRYGDKYKGEIINALNGLGYNIEDLGVAKSDEVKLKGPFKEEMPTNALYLKEKDLVDRTTQLQISQGMFRAISLIVLINYSIFESKTCLILVDDIGEGLDYDRANSLIKYLVNKTEKAKKIQLIMSTNDRFVMNVVPLKYWSIMLRDGADCKIFNYDNSKKIFEDFEFTGMSNFDLFSTEFFKTGFENK